MDELIYASVIKLARSIADKEVSSQEVVEAYLTRIAAVNPKLNAVVQVRADTALAQAKKMDKALARGKRQGPLHGVPMTIKDSLDTVDAVTTWGTPGRKQFVPKADATVVARMKAAGAILIGKTNTPELTLSYETTNPIYGATNNPYDLERTPGGSSGGAAAIVAAGGSPIDLGSDTGGSLRLPAHVCGIAAIKPTSGRVPRTGHAIGFGGIIDSFTQIGPLARYVEDLALVLPIIAGSDRQDPSTVPVGLGDPQVVNLGKLRGAFFTDNGICSPTSEVANAIQLAVQALSEAGVGFEEVRPPGISETVDIFSGLFTADGGAWVRRLLERAQTALSDTSLKSYAAGSALSVAELVHLIDRWDQFKVKMRLFLAPYDILLSPVSAYPALLHGETQYSTSAFSYTMTHNLTGWPTAVVRVATSPEGLPIGVQIAAPPWREDIALAVAQHLEHTLGGWQPSSHTLAPPQDKKGEGVNRGFFLDALSQNTFMGMREDERQWDYWREQLSGELPILNLPTDHARSAVGSYREASVSLEIPVALTHQLRLLAEEQGVTDYMLLLAAFQLLLHRYTAQDEILVGSPVAGRDLLEGTFTNVVVMRANLAGTPPFTHFLQQVRGTVLDGLAHQDFPFSLLAERLQETQTTHVVPIYQAAFALQVSSDESPLINRDRLEVSSSPVLQYAGPFDLFLELFQTGNALVGSFKYDANLFEEATIQRMAGNFNVLLNEILKNPTQSMAELPILTKAERHQLLVEWNDTATDYPKDKCVHQLFSDQVVRTPDAIAVVFDDEQLTYRELNKRANQLAHYLQSWGVETETLVGICVERSIEMVVGLLGILKSGAAYVPLDPNYPQERLDFMIQDSGVSLLLTQEYLQKKLPASSAHLICLDREWEQIARQNRALPHSQVDVHNLAYVIYTSGSTGYPKGVMIPHQALCNHMWWMKKAFNLNINDKILQKTPFSFDASVWEFYAPLIVGGQLVVAQPGGHQDAAYLSQAIQKYGITILQLVPTQLKMLLETKEFGECTTLRRIFCGGEPLTLDICQKFSNLQMPATLGNLYGPAEACIDTTFWPVQDGVDIISIGRPIDNVQLYILDSSLQLCPIGVPGELHIGGAGLARGYLNRPKLTNERFIPNPFGAKENPEKLYKTGDLVRYLPDGSIEFLARLDHQVKIRGFRIELAEIEARLTEQPNVREAVVVAQEGVSGKQLVAYVVGEASAEERSIEELRAKLSQSLPEYMIPSFFVQLDVMPLTPNGKIDRRALAATPLESARSNLLAKETIVPPSTPTEIALANIWSEVLGIEQADPEQYHISIHTNFFKLGGHSLLATQAISRIRQTFALEVSMRTFFKNPTLVALAAEIDARIDNPNSTTPQPMPVISPRPEGTRRDRPLLLSFAQQRLWFLDQLEPDSAFYNIPRVIRLTGQLNVNALEESFRYLIERHESLRTVFGVISADESKQSSDGEPIQVIHRPSWAAQFVLRLRAVASEEEARKQGQIEAMRPFNLSEGPLLRVQLLQMADDNHLLLINMHHIISDGWSIGVFIQELTHAYRAYTAGDAPTLPDLPIQYADFALWQRTHLSGETLERQLAYWREQLTGAPALLELPSDRLRPAIQSYQGAHYVFKLDADLTAKLKQLAQDHDATLFMVLLAAFNVLLARYSGQGDIVVGSPIANRNHAEIEGLIGFFINTLVLRTHLEDNPSFTELLVQVRQTTLDAYQHQDLPFERLVDELNLERALSYSPLFQVMLTLQNDEMGNVIFPNLKATMQPIDLPFAKFDLTLNLLENGTGLTGIFEYATDLFDEATIARIASHFTVLLERIVEQPTQPVLQLPLLTDGEYHQIVHEWNDTAVDFGDPQTIHALFEQQVERTPDAVALVMASNRATPADHTLNSQSSTLKLTYRELNTRANQLAHYLIELGVQADTLVAVAMERSLDMVVSLLAVLKAGGAYIPIDPTYPTARIQYMLADSAVPILLTQSYLAGAEEAFLTTEGHRKHLIAVDKTELTDQSTGNPQTPTSVKDLAYVIYTSGSTGRPKGIAITHQNVANFLAAMEQEPGLQAHDRLLALTTISFDIAVLELYLPLVIGASVVLASTNDTMDPQALIEHIQHYQITVIQATPATWTMLTSHQDWQITPRLKVLCGGEALSMRLAQKLLDHSQHTWNMYGPTEATVWVSAAHLRKEQPRVTLGPPIANTTFYILDNDGAVVPVGVAGELHIGGTQLARGYLNRPRLTAERFINHPQFGRLYKTGDMCRWLSDGNPSTGSGQRIEYIGRTDFQVKLRGFRIELGEIEHALLTQAGVGEAVVLLRDDKREDDKRLVAYIVGDANIDGLRQQLSQRLPAYMVPSAFVRLESMPTTPNGKLNRRALLQRPLDPAYRDDQHELVAPRNEMEQELAKIWCDVLHLDQVSIYDDFFALGGHSLLATQVASRIKRKIGVMVPLVSLFEYKNVASLARFASMLKANFQTLAQEFEEI